MSKLIPFAHAEKIYDIDIDFFVKNKIKYIFIDLDNTLAPHNIELPSKQTIQYLAKLKNANITPIIVSNNKKKRVSKYCIPCEVDFIFKAGKPFPFKINKYISQHKIDKNYVIMIGDQLLTDVRCSKFLKIRCILTEKLWSGDQLITKFVRWIDVYKRNRLRKNNLLVDWRNVDGRIE